MSNSKYILFFREKSPEKLKEFKSFEGVQEEIVKIIDSLNWWELHHRILDLIELKSDGSMVVEPACHYLPEGYKWPGEIGDKFEGFSYKNLEGETK